MNPPSNSKLSLALLTAGLGLSLCACPPTGVVCSEGLSRCGLGCADFATDRRNCGACANVCPNGQVCQAAACICQAGATLCADGCALTASDPGHCGACGTACAVDQVCEAGQCKSACVLGTSTRCGQSCVNLLNDPGHCGGCGSACEAPQSCRSGICTYDVVAACFSNGQVTGIQAGSDFKGPNEPLGSGPAALASLQDVLLSADGVDARLYQARLTSVGGHAFAVYPASARTGGAPNQVRVDDPYIYVVNASGGSLQVLLRGGASDAGFDADAGEDAGAPDPRLDGGRFPEGLQYATVAELSFGANTFPEGMARLGNFLYVPLYGGMSSATAPAGQKVAKVDVTDPRNPAVVDTIDLSGMDLKPFDGGTPVPRPYAIAAHQGLLYVALNNLNADTYAPEGPGLLARIDPATRAVSTVDLGPTCLNAIWVVSDGTRLYVSCQGRSVYDSSWALVSVEKTGVVVVEQDAPVSTWSPVCPADAGSYQSDGGGCLPISASRFAVQGGKLYVGDQSGGRIFVLEGPQLVERRGYFAVDGGAPIQACAVNPTLGYSNVSDVLAQP